MISSDALGSMATIRKLDLNPVPVTPLVARADEEGVVTGVTCPLNAAVDLHGIVGCKDLLESCFMQVMSLSLATAVRFPVLELLCYDLVNYLKPLICSCFRLASYCESAQPSCIMTGLAL